MKIWCLLTQCAAAAFLLLAAPACSVADDGSVPEINSYAECVAAGYPVMRSLPARCAVPGGRVFTDDGKLPQVSGSSKGKLCKDLCGDGECAEMVCMAEGCPCAETAQNCPKDCK